MGTLLAIARAEIPYIPTEKKAVRGHFLRLAWPHLLVLFAFVVTLARTSYLRFVRFDEAALRLTSEAVWGMTGFAAVPAILVCAAVRTAWLSRHPPTGGGAWDAVDITRIGTEAA
jgi:hypothetical protein